MNVDSPIRSRATPPRGRVARGHAVGLAFALSVVGGTVAVAEGPSGPTGTLTVTAGSLAGRLLDSPPCEPGERPVIRWESAEFASPLEFPSDMVARMLFPTPDAAGPGNAPAPWRVDLAAGDALVGGLVAIDGATVKLSIGDGPQPATLAVARSMVKRIVRHESWRDFEWDGSLDAWTPSSAEHWTRTPRGIANRRPWASLARTLGEARRFRLDLRLAWRDPPVVRIGIGAGRGPVPSPAGPAGGVGGEDADPAPGAREERPMPYRVEIDPTEVVAVRDEADASGRGAADLRVCGPTPEKGIGLSMFVDELAGRMVVTDADTRRTLADLVLPSGQGTVERTLRIEVGGGEVELQAVRMTPWKGDAFADDVAAGRALVLRDGSTLFGSVTAMAEGGNGIAVRPADGGPDRSVALESLQVIPFAAADGASDVPEDPSGSVRVTDRFGSRFVGTLSRVERGKAWVAHRAFEGEVGIPLDRLVAIESIVPPAAAPPLPGPKGRYVGDAADIEGCLVRVEAEGSSTIGWLPEGSVTAAVPARADDGRPRPATIRYRTTRSDPPDAGSIGKIGAMLDYADGRVTVVSAVEGGPLAEVGLGFPLRILAVAPRADGRFVEMDGLAPDMVTSLLQGPLGSEVTIRIEESPGDDPRTIGLTRREVGPHVGMLSLEQILAVQEQLLQGLAAPEAPLREKTTSVVVLVTGETIGCRVESLDERGLLVRRPDGEGVTIPHALVQAVELIPSPRATLTPEKFRSLVTLPRSQRGQPPTHLVRSVSGDYLRGRVLSLDADGLKIALDADPRGKPTTIPRAEAARIVWLHPEVLADDWVPPRADPPEGVEVEAVGPAGRTRIVVDSVDGSVLTGRHAVLGPWRIDLEGIDRLRLGGVIDASPLAAPYSKWQLQAAPEPRNLPPRAKPRAAD